MFNSQKVKMSTEPVMFHDYTMLVPYSAQKKKLSAPEEGQNFPLMIKSQTFCVSVYSLGPSAKLQPQYNSAKQIWPTSIGKKFFAGFGAESFFF